MHSEDDSAAFPGFYDSKLGGVIANTLLGHYRANGAVWREPLSKYFHVKVFRMVYFHRLHCIPMP